VSAAACKVFLRYAGRGMRLFDERAALGRVEPCLRAVGLAIWAFVGISHWSGSRPSWLLPWLVYGGALAAGSLRARLPDAVNLVVLLVQSAAALVLPSFGLAGFEGLLLSIVVAQVPTVLCFPASVAWAVAQTPLLLAVVFRSKSATEQMEILGAYSAFSSFALLVYWIHLQERRARRDLAETNAVLLSTRALLVEGSRHGERLRISRELHDSLGHHLTALSVQLALAEKLAKGRVADPVGKARAIARESLADVRRVVSATRSFVAADLVDALRAVAAGIPTPSIAIHANDDLPQGSDESSHAVFRCVQEAITNSLRHSSARHVWVELARSGEGMEVRIRDDGNGVSVLILGNGLRGMQERAAQVGGTVEFTSSSGRGFEVHMFVPLRPPT
jgi:signal transduction histidine kinase